MDDSALSEFMDRLEGHDIAADIYLPVEFEGIVEVAGLRVGSLPLLLEVLDELKDELDDEEEEAEDEESYDDDQKILAQQLRVGVEALLDRRRCGDGATPAAARQIIRVSQSSLFC